MEGSEVTAFNIHGSQCNLLLYLPLPRALVAPSTISAMPSPQILPGRGRALICRGFKLHLGYFIPAEGQTLGQLGLHRIDAPGVSAKIRVILSNLVLDEYPVILYFVLIWRVEWVVGNIDIVACNESLR